MTQERREDVRVVVKSKLYFFMEADEAEKTTNLMLEDIVRDIEETADEDFSASDIDMAMSRVVRKCINEHYNAEDYE